MDHAMLLLFSKKAPAEIPQKKHGIASNYINTLKLILGQVKYLIQEHQIKREMSYGLL